jgi:acyl carrier protein
MATVYERVKAIVVDKLDVKEGAVVPSASFVDDLNADSLDLAELIMAFEEEFSDGDTKIEISDDEAGQIVTIQNALDYLKGRGVQDA